MFCLPLSHHIQQNFNTYTPSPSPYGNLGPSNLSHTSSTLLMPQSSVGSSTGPPSILSGSINPALILPSSSTAMTTGFGEFSCWLYSFFFLFRLAFLCVLLKTHDRYPFQREFFFFSFSLKYFIRWFLRTRAD